MNPAAIEVKEFPEARKPAWKLKIDFGEAIGIKKSSAQIVANYDQADLIGKQVLAVINFPPRQIGPFMSEVLTLGFTDADNNVVLRQDLASREFDRDALLANAPEQEDDSFQVPQILSNDD